jgi:hypothetical protein
MFAIFLVLAVITTVVVVMISGLRAPAATPADSRIRIARELTPEKHDTTAALASSFDGDAVDKRAAEWPLNGLDPRR